MDVDDAIERGLLDANQVGIDGASRFRLFEVQELGIKPHTGGKVSTPMSNGRHLGVIIFVVPAEESDTGQNWGEVVLLKYGDILPQNRWMDGTWSQILSDSIRGGYGVQDTDSH